mgnify:CR=1 FL=1
MLIAIESNFASTLTVCANRGKKDTKATIKDKTLFKFKSPNFNRNGI